jgi:hypothetical protein
MKAENFESSRIKNALRRKYNNIDVVDAIENKDGTISLVIGGDKASFNSVINKSTGQDIDSLPEISIDDIEKLRPTMRKFYEKASSVISRDPLSRSYLDLQNTPYVDTATPQELYERSLSYYRTEDVYGSVIDLLTNFSAKGFTNEIDDPTIRNFYDNWTVDVKFNHLVRQLFLELYRSSLVRTFKVYGKYVPKINHVSAIPGKVPAKIKKEVAAKKIKWAKTDIPIKYTILNPTQIKLEKVSLLADQEFVTIKGSALKDIKELLDISPAQLTEAQKLIINNLPSEVKKAAQDGKDLFLDPKLVGAIDYKKQPYELYPYPRGARAFESMEYKKSLRQADYSTLDGITNYLLVITIGNDNFPVKSMDKLEAVAALFNTPSKSFDVVWDHTLKVERVEPSKVGDILGQDKYKQVNDDITGAFGVIRALIDGVGDPTSSSADLAVKSVIEEINYARELVKEWIYAEYTDVAESLSFDRYPKVRFDTMVLKNELLAMNVIQGLIDRRIISYRRGHELLGFDHEAVASELTEEKEQVLAGNFGIIGSPYNPKASPFVSDNIQDEQRTPKGTPSEGRPKGRKADTPKQNSKPNKQKKKELDSSVGSLIDSMSEDELESIFNYMKAKLEDKRNNGD